MKRNLTEAQKEKYKLTLLALKDEFNASDEKHKKIVQRKIERLVKKGYSPAAITAMGYYAVRYKTRPTPREAEAFKKKGEYFLLKFAELGEPKDKTAAGYGFEHGSMSLPVNLELAAKCYRMAADEGDGWGWHDLGCCYRFGRGVAADYKKAVECFENATAAGNLKGLESLAYMYENGKGVEENFFKAKECFETAIRMANEQLVNPEKSYHNEETLKEVIAESEKALEELRVLMLSRGSRAESSTEKNKDNLEEILASANAGNGWAQFEMGVAYEEGIHGVQQDSQKAIEWYRIAGANGMAGAMCKLGAFYQEGWGVEKDFEKAVQYYLKADKMTGNRRAQSNLGICYEKGYGVPKDYREAAKWYRKAAEQDIVYAQTRLGYFYEQGLGGLPKDERQAAYWYERACTNKERIRDERNCLEWLGTMYMEGRGVPKDYRRALELLQEAATNGSSYAEKKLQELYRRRNRIF